MSVISRRFAQELTEKRMRDAYLSAQTRTKLSNQIRVIRTQRGWSQGDFAKILGKPQSNVSRLENREYGNFTLKTLLELAFAFDCGLVVEFVPYEKFLRRTHDLSTENLKVQSFTATALEPLYCDVQNPISQTDWNESGTEFGSAPETQVVKLKEPRNLYPLSKKAHGDDIHSLVTRPRMESWQYHHAESSCRAGKDVLARKIDSTRRNSKKANPRKQTGTLKERI